MFLIQYIPMLEVLFFNLFAINKCCHKKYSAAKTVLVLFLWSALLLVISNNFVEYTGLKGNGQFMTAGLLYLIPLKFLYKEKILILCSVTCTCCVYTIGIFAVSRQLSYMMGSEFFLLLILENIIFLITLVPFYRQFMANFIRVLNNIGSFDKQWYKYLAITSCLFFITFSTVQSAFISETASIHKILALVFLLVTIFMSYFIFYRIIMDSLKMAQLEQAVLYDPLTGLGNRKHLWENLHSLIDADQTFSVLFMDLDHFKQINDQYGHMVGDEYLKHFGRISSDILQDHGEVYRFGGDEFVAVYRGIVPESVLTALKECRDWDTGAPCPFNQVSTGFLLCQPPHKSVEEILHRVDELMYENKLKKKEQSDAPAVQ